MKTCKTCNKPIACRTQCSTCRNKARRDKAYDERWGTPDDPKARCEWCEKPFMPKRSAKGTTRFCSKRCWTRNDFYEKNGSRFLSSCDICDKPIDFEQKVSVKGGRAIRRRRRLDTTVCSPECNRTRNLITWHLRNPGKFQTSVDALERRRYGGRAPKDPKVLAELIEVIAQRKPVEPEEAQDDDD